VARTHPLVGTYAQGMSVCALQWVTYKVTATNQLTRDQHDGNGPLAIAYYVASLPAVQVIQAPSTSKGDAGALQVTINGSTTGANTIQSGATNIIHLRNYP
jgi:hypothetical protein